MIVQHQEVQCEDKYMVQLDLSLEIVVHKRMLIQGASHH